MIAEYKCDRCNSTLHTDQEKDQICHKCKQDMELIFKSWHEGQHPNWEFKTWSKESEKNGKK